MRRILLSILSSIESAWDLITESNSYHLGRKRWCPNVCCFSIVTGLFCSYFRNGDTALLYLRVLLHTLSLPCPQCSIHELSKVLFFWFLFTSMSTKENQNRLIRIIDFCLSNILSDLCYLCYKVLRVIIKDDSVKNFIQRIFIGWNKQLVARTSFVKPVHC